METKLLIKKKQQFGKFEEQDLNKRMVWHGTKNTEPSIIYKSVNEAFDASFSRVALQTAFFYLLFPIFRLKELGFLSFWLCEVYYFR